MGKVFVNYRREDSEHASGWLVDVLQRRLGKGNVFQDIKSLAKGDRFDLAIDHAVARCDAMVVVIARDWLSLKDEDGIQRLFSEKDFLRREIESAISLAKPILPVLVGGASMPAESDLPDTIKSLTLWNAARISSDKFADDADKVADHVKAMTSIRGIQPWWIAAAAALALVVGLGAGYGAQTYLTAEQLKKSDEQTAALEQERDAANQSVTDALAERDTALAKIAGAEEGAAKAVAARDRLKSDLDRLKGELDRTKRSASVLESERREMRRSIDDVQTARDGLRSKVNELTLKLQEADLTTSALERDLEAVKKQLAAAVEAHFGTKSDYGKANLALQDAAQQRLTLEQALAEARRLEQLAQERAKEFAARLKQEEKQNKTLFDQIEERSGVYKATRGALQELCISVRTVSRHPEVAQIWENFTERCDVTFTFPTSK